MNRSPEPLSPEERALAERLARLDARREPAPALDAAILAAARAAVGGEAVATVAATARPQAAQGEAGAKADDAGTPGATASNVLPLQAPPRPARKPMSRWPLGLSLAASLVLAAGIGWRLADGGGSESAMQSVAVSMEAPEEKAVYADAAAAAEEPTQAVMVDPEMNRIPPPPPPPPLAAQPSARREVAMVPPEAKRQADIGEVAAPAHDGFVMDEAVPHEAEADATAASVAGASATSAFPADAPARGNAAAKPAATGGSSEGLAGRSRQAAETAKDDRAGDRDKIEVVGSRVARQAAPAAPPPPAVSAPVPASAADADQPFDDQPPVSADSPQFRQAWLQRIRKQFAEGQVEAGRNSLQEFRRRYPDVELPDDLKKIAATLPPPTP
jgi:resuscitation-promoting factor RpfA